MAFFFLQAGAAQNCALVHQDIISNLGGLAYNHASAVIDEEASSDFGAGVDFDIGNETIDVGYESGKKA